LNKNFWIDGLLKKIYGIQSVKLHTYNMELLQTMNNLTNLCIHMKKWEEAKIYGAQLIPIFEFIYPPNHPLIGLQYFLVGKIEWFLNYTFQAHGYFLQAKKILYITHNKSDSLLETLETFIKDAEMEAQFIRFRKLDINNSQPQ